MIKAIINHWDLNFVGSIMMFFIFIMPVSAIENHRKYTLSESVQEALAKNPVIKAKQEAVETARYSKLKARSNLFPSLTTYYGYTHESDRDLWGFPMSTKENYEWWTTIEQPVFKGFALTNTVKHANLEQDLTMIKLKIEKQKLALRVNQAYYHVLKADRKLDVASQAVESIKGHLTIANSFYEVGRVPAHDLLEAEVRYANAEEELISAQNRAHLARTTFNILLVRPLEEPFILEDILTYKPIPSKIETDIEMLSKRRLELKAVKIDFRMSALEEKIAQGAYYPEIYLRADYIREGDGYEVSGSDYHKEDYWNASVLLTWRFWASGKNYYNVREKQSLKKQLLHTRVMIANQIKLEIKQALLELKRAVKKIPITIKAVNLAKEHLRIKQERYQMQIATSTEVVDAQILLSESQNHYYNALYDSNLAKAKLARAINE